MSNPAKKWGPYEASRAILAITEASREFADLNAIVEWAKGPRRRRVSPVALARLESGRDAMGRRVLKLIEACPASMFRRAAARGDGSDR